MRGFACGAECHVVCRYLSVQVREGFMNVFIFLPTVLGHLFEHHVGTVVGAWCMVCACVCAQVLTKAVRAQLPAILQGLADEAEAVREASLKAGQVIVANYGTRSLDLLLPALEDGLFRCG